jgi:hypothetical protein
MLLAAPHAADPFGCAEVTSFFRPCLDYAFGTIIGLLQGH